ncbi:MAG TPA: HD domain-containing phosphohydrolase, partial [Candidatus Baltobacteraceae bacterium]
MLAGDLLTALLVTLDACNPGARKASRETGVWSKRIARAMSQNVADVATASFVGALHDIGMIATPLQVLQKPGTLSMSEWEIIRAHATAGARIIDQIPSLRKLAPAVR